MTSTLECRSIFVTVGTTEFDELVECLDCAEFVSALSNIGCKNLTIQIGRGKYEPFRLNDLCRNYNISYSCFRFKPTLDEDMHSADLIISHCGAGSILECLSLRKLFVVVVNETLQGNHQSELATELAAGSYCFSTYPTNLIPLLSQKLSIDAHSLKRFTTGDPKVFSEIVDGCFDWIE